MKHLKFLFYFLAILVVSGISDRVEAEPLTRVAIIPSVLDLTLQYATLAGYIDDDSIQYRQILDDLISYVNGREGIRYSEYEFEHGKDAAERFLHEKPYPGSAKRFDADILVFIGNADKGAFLEVFSVAVESARAVSFFVPWSELTGEILSSRLREVLEDVLDIREELLVVHADRIEKPEAGVVTFDIPTLNNHVVRLHLDYDHSQESIERFHFTLAPSERVDGEVEFFLPAKENHDISLKFVYENARLKDQFFDVNMAKRPDSGKTESTVISLGGYPVSFKLNWQNQEIKAVDPQPEIHPFRPHLLPAKSTGTSL